MCGDCRHVFDNAGVFPCLELEVIGFGVSLIAHLSSELGMLAGHFHHEFAFEECAAHRFFNVYVFAVGESQHCNGEVHVVGH